MDNLIKYGNFKSIGKTKRKTQIILGHTSREVEEYLASLKFRYHGKYDKLPHFVINKEGLVIQLLDTETFSNILPQINNNGIFILLENLGWLEKKVLTNHYINWKGSIYTKEVFEKKWRDYFFWDPYTENQYESLGKLCNDICEKHNIEKVTSGHNTKFEGIERLNGIVSRSNFDVRFTDVNPSFSFETLQKKIENEYISRQ